MKKKPAAKSNATKKKPIRDLTSLGRVRSIKGGIRTIKGPKD